MKKILFASMAAIVFTVGMSSCTKCQICKKTSEPETRICRNDYGSETAYGFAIDAKKAQGFDCRASL